MAQRPSVFIEMGRPQAPHCDDSPQSALMLGEGELQSSGLSRKRKPRSGESMGLPSPGPSSGTGQHKVAEESMKK